MRAAYYEVNGAAGDVLRLGDIETPEPEPGEVRVRVKTSGVNPSDVKMRAGCGPCAPISVSPGGAAQRRGRRDRSGWRGRALYAHR